MTGEQVRELRASLGISASDFALLLGVTPSTVYRWGASRAGEAATDPGPARLLAALQHARHYSAEWASLARVLPWALSRGGLFALFVVLQHCYLQARVAHAKLWQWPAPVPD
jgi:transcriptional regulator with XRE-family HTH domain